MEAEALLARLEELAGGKTEVEHAGHEHGHTHTHADGTTHQH
jgi:hypothetical protein